ncbi:MAG: pilus assembly protein PilM [Limisphaerales bacterium]
MIGFPFWPAHRQIAIDLGSRCVKVLVAEPAAQGVRILQHQTIDLHEEGLLSAEEINQHLQWVVHELGDHPVALAVPEHLTISQAIDLPLVDDAETERLIEEQTVSFREQSDSAVLYDHVRLQPHGKLINPWWVTLAREDDIQKQLERLAAVEGGVSEITTPANALVAAYLATRPTAEDAVLVDLGARSTLFAIICGGQGLCAASFPTGSEALTEAIMKAKGCSFEEADARQRSENFFQSERHLAGLDEAVGAWFRNLEKTVSEWRAANANLAPAIQRLPLRLSGGGSRQPGLLDHLKALSGFEIALWPAGVDGAPDLPLDRFAVAYGIALAAFNRSPQPVSLLPARLRAVEQRVQRLAQLNFACAAGLLVLAVLLIFGGWQKFNVLQRKKHLIHQAELALERAQEIASLTGRRDREYQRLWPVLERQKETVDLLKTLRVMQQSRLQKEFWYVLLADQQSYASGATLPPPATNEVAAANTNALAVSSATNAAVFIAELCIPGDGDKALRTLSDLVADLKKKTLFRRVDTLPSNQKRNLVDPKALVPDRHFSLFFELAEATLDRPGLLPLRTDAHAGTNGFKRSSPLLKPKADPESAVTPRKGS